MEENQIINQNDNTNVTIKKENTVLPILSFVFGIVGLVAMILKFIDLLIFVLPTIFMVLFFLVMPASAIIALIFGAISKKKFQKGTKPHLFSLLGFIFGIVGITLFIVNTGLVIFYFFQKIF